MQRTIRLFEIDVYRRKCVSRILGKVVRGDKELVVLDQSLFFPTGGGQPCDLGSIGNVRVLDVFMEDEVIYHHVEACPEDDEVECVLDWNRRFDHMQQHSGEHVLSGIFLREYGIHNKGFHLGEDYVAVDMDIEELTQPMIDHVEQKANEGIWENRPITIETVMSQEEATKYSLRKMPEINEDIRIVSIDAIDKVACCGTHPSMTGEIGLIKIIRCQKYKGMNRVFFYCGQRAFRDYQSKHLIVNQLNVKYSADTSTLLSKIEIDSQKKQHMGESLAKLRKKLSSFEADLLLSRAVDNKIVNLYEEQSTEGLQQISGILTAEKPDYLIILGSLTSGTLLITHGGAHSIDCSNYLKELISQEPFRSVAKGGGSKTKAQATFIDFEVMKRVLKW